MPSPARTPRPAHRGPAARAAPAAARRLPPIVLPGHRRAARPTRTSSSRSTAATSCTTAASTASTSAGSGSRRCWRCARRSRTSSRPGCSTRSGRPTTTCARARGHGRRAARRSPTPTTRRRCRRYLERDGHARAVPRVRRCTARPTSSRRPTRTRGRSRGCRGAPKAALVEIQADEYGGGRAERIHAQLFADAMDGARPRRDLRRLPRRHPGRDARDRQPDVAVRAAPALARRDRRPPRAVRDDLVGAQRAATRAALRRLGLGDARRAFFDEHVEADAVHENIAAVDLAGGLARAEPAADGRRSSGARGRWRSSRRAGRATCSTAGSAASARWGRRSHRQRPHSRVDDLLPRDVRVLLPPERQADQARCA